MGRIEIAEALFTKLHDEDILADDPNYRDIIVRYLYGDVYQHGSTNIDFKELILIVVNTVNHTLLTLKEHVLAGLKSNLSPIEIKEAIYQCTPYIGIGKVQEALMIVNEVFKKQGMSLPLENQAIVNEETRLKKGFEVQSLAFSKEAIQTNHDNAPQELKHIQNYLSEYCFGDFYTRNGLDLPKRELLTMVMLASLGECESQLRSHVQANLTVGNNRNQLIETITICQPYIGFPRTLNALNIINEITNKENKK